MFKKGKIEGIKEKLEGFVKLDKGSIAPGTGVAIADVVKGTSADNGDFIYILGYYAEKPVFVSVPAASLDDFAQITPEDVAEIKAAGLKFYVESRTSKANRQYFVAWIDE